MRWRKLIVLRENKRKSFKLPQPFLFVPGIYTVIAIAYCFYMNFFFHLGVVTFVLSFSQHCFHSMVHQSLFYPPIVARLYAHTKVSLVVIFIPNERWKLLLVLQKREREETLYWVCDDGWDIKRRGKKYHITLAIALRGRSYKYAVRKLLPHFYYIFMLIENGVRGGGLLSLAVCGLWNWKTKGN